MKAKILKTVATSLSAVLLLGAFTLANAGVNQRQRRQQRAIRQGIKNGELTRPEVRRLEREQARIQRNEARARSDGKFTARERARINREQNRARVRIYRQKHDRQ